MNGKQYFLRRKIGATLFQLLRRVSTAAIFLHVREKQNLNTCLKYIHKFKIKKIGLGSKFVYKFDVYHQKWERFKNIELVRGTICFGELVTEFSKHDETIRLKTLHIIDALRLGETPLTQFSFKERYI